MEPVEFYTVEEMADKFGDNPDSIRAAISRGTFPFQDVKVGTKRIFPKCLVDKTINDAVNSQTDYRVIAGNIIKKK